MIPYNKNLNKIKTYIPGKSSNNSKKKEIKLSSNESAIEFSFSTKKIIQNLKVNFSKYPDPNCNILRKKIAKIHNIHSNNIIFGNGSDEIFFLIAYCYLNKGLEGIYSKYGFLIYPIAINAAGGKCIVSDEKNFTANVDDIIKKSSKNTRVCFIANPNNPTGTYLNKKEIKRLRENLPKKCLLIIDSAYSEYVVKNDYSDSLNYAKTRNDIIVTHTFSKIYGLSALRLGWAYCPKNIAITLNKIRPAFNINSYAQLIGKNILDDKDFIKRSIAHNIFWNKWLSDEFKKLGFKVIESVANFILIKLKNSNQANLLADELEKKNIFIRKLDSYNLDSFLRISIGLEKDLKALLKNVKKIIKDNKNDFI